MSIRFNHTLVHAHDKKESANFLTGILDLPEASSFGPFLVVELSNGVSLDFLEVGDGEVTRQHYAFLIDEDEFDAIFERIRTRGLDYWADPFKQHPGEINTNDGGRGVYFDDPNGHVLEVITRPYGSGRASH
jgi:extradiol dioxygenase family protein